MDYFFFGLMFAQDVLPDPCVKLAFPCAFASVSGRRLRTFMRILHIFLFIHQKNVSEYCFFFVFSNDAALKKL